jgi:hypothetical protein
MYGVGGSSSMVSPHDGNDSLLQRVKPKLGSKASIGPPPGLLPRLSCLRWPGHATLGTRGLARQAIRTSWIILLHPRIEQDILNVLLGLSGLIAL